MAGMRHVTLTCLHHPNLRWSCKEIAVDSIGRYNGARNIFYIGTAEDLESEKWVASEPECTCKASDLRFSPEELELQKTEPLGD